jgi:hypothetical protein
LSLPMTKSGTADRSNKIGKILRQFKDWIWNPDYPGLELTRFFDGETEPDKFKTEGLRCAPIRLTSMVMSM